MEMDERCIDCVDEYFTEINPDSHYDQLKSLAKSVQSPTFYNTLLKRSVVSKLHDRAMISLVVTVLYELEQQFTFDTVNNKLTRYLEVVNHDINETKYISRNRFLCKVEGINRTDFPTITKSFKSKTTKMMGLEDNSNVVFDELICVLSFEDSFQFKIGQRYHMIGIYQSSRFDEDSELDIKIPTNHRFYPLLYRPYGVVEYYNDLLNISPIMIPILETKPNQSNTISPSSIESRNLLLQMLNVVVPNPLQTPLLLSLVSSVHSRDPILLQHYTLCIEVDNVIQMVGELTEAISSVYPFVENISIGNGILLPNITNETKEYTKHPLQVSSGSVLIISTTQEIQSDNFELLLDLIEKRTLRITMYNVNVDIPVDCKVIFVIQNNTNKELTQYCDQTICIHQGFNNKNIRDFLDKLTPQEIEEMRHYLAYCNGIQCVIPKRLQEIVTTSFVSARQQNSKIDQMTLHQWLNTSSILGSSYGLEEVTEKIWEEMLEMRMQLTN